MEELSVPPACAQAVAEDNAKTRAQCTMCTATPACNITVLLLDLAPISAHSSASIEGWAKVRESENCASIRITCAHRADTRGHATSNCAQADRSAQCAHSPRRRE